MARYRTQLRPLSDAPIDWLAERFRRHLHMPDLGPLYLLMGSVAANLLQGEPVWLMLVGPPSSGKTELLNSLLKLKQVEPTANISDVSAFLSATPVKDRHPDSHGGILRKVGDHGAVVINDFTSILTLEKKQMDKILGVFRECYSGHWTRDVGAEGGMKLHWDGKVAFFGGVTGVIDRFQEVNSSLGERWMYCRMPEGDGFERSKMVLRHSSKGEWRKELSDSVAAFFAGLDLGFGKEEGRRELTDAEMFRVIRIGTVGARCRSPVLRDGFSREVIGAREQEQEPRFVAALGQLLIGMEAIGIDERERWRLIGNTALDSMTRLRRYVIEESKAAGEVGVKFDRLIPVMGCSRTTAERTVEDLTIHGVVEKRKKDGNVSVVLTDWMREEWRKGWG